MDLSTPLSTIKGIGPKTTATLQKAGLITIRDLLYYLPRTYESFQAVAKISDIRPGKVIIKGKIDSIRTTNARRRHLTITEAVIRDNSGAVRTVWFNQAYREHQFRSDREYYFTGTYAFKNGRYQLSAPQVRDAREIEQSGTFQPVYSQKSQLKPEFFKRIIGALRPHFAKIPDLIPSTPHSPSFVKNNARAEALYKIHFPLNTQETESARTYLAYEELIEFLYAARLNRIETRQLPAPVLKFNQTSTKKLVQNLPFQLTKAQRIATWDILRDLARPVPMNRLLQGDVGSGKTVVAAIAAAQAATAGAQVALLAPTSVLASQHYTELTKLLEPFGIKVALLVGSTKHKAELKKQLKSGEIQLLVGTHAIITDDTEFANLAFCIIDEQHRFGVNQRQKLLEKSNVRQTGHAPHLLSMTATPIPRSLQLTLFGDLDISVLNELPAGRQPIQTQILPELSLSDELYPLMRQKLQQNEQIYWICAAIDDNARSETTSVKKQAKKLQDLFPRHKIGLLHGRMKPAEKDAIMTDFSAGKIDLLVSTTVVEVGVNVPNATVIIIQDADKYGLAQLHQLRGRVGRGTKQSFCFLLVSEDSGATQRLRELEKSTDGFHLAEVDLKLRGPGEIYGSLQHGALDLRIASLSDTILISQATKQVDDLLALPDFMKNYPEFAENIKHYQQLTTLN